MSLYATPAAERLRDAWSAYIRAQFGELNTTADELEKAAKACGWRGRFSDDGALKDWAPAFLIGIGYRL